MFYDTHSGYDWLMPEGTPILAVAEGEVTFAGIGPPGPCPPLDREVDDQQQVIILHVAPNGERFTSFYAHVSRIDVKVGQHVQAGQQIALSGDTGCSTIPHLHFGVYRLTNTNNGQPVAIDPYGWDSNEPDPWAEHPEGAQSIWLWKEGQAPEIFGGFEYPANPGPEDQAAVAITEFRWTGVRDNENPNNEFVKLELDPRYAPSGTFDLTGFTLTNSGGDSFQFPDGFTITQDQPVRVFTGSGINSETQLYWGLSSGVWDNMGDCVFLVAPVGWTMYYLSSGPEC